MPPPAVSKEIIERLMRQRVRKLAFRLGLFVILPTVLASIYFMFFATREYESVASVIVQEADPLPTWTEPQGPGGFVEAPPSTPADPKHKVPASTPARDANAVRTYFASKAAFEAVNKKFHLVEHFSSSKVDLFRRLRGNKSVGKGYEMFSSLVSTELDPPSGVVTLRVRGFDKALTQKVAQALIKGAESNLNRAWKKEYESRLKSARALEDSTTQALAEAEAAVKVLEAQAALPATPKAVMSVPAKSASANPAPADKAQLPVELTMARDKLASAAAAHHWAFVSRVIAETEAKRTHRWVVDVVSPTKPDAPVYPRPLQSTLAVMLFCLLASGIVSLILAAVREHAEI